jgi:hypothetical protein
MKRNSFARVFCVTMLVSALSGGRASADSSDPVSINLIADSCWWNYFLSAGDSTPWAFGEQFEIASAWDLYGLSWSGSTWGGSFDTRAPQHPAGLSADATDCKDWQWTHIKNAQVQALVINPSTDNRFGYHVYGPEVTDPVSYCPHSNVSYVVMGKNPVTGEIFPVASGQKWGLNGSGPNQSGPCSGLSVNNFPCSDDYYCGTDSATIDTTTYPELWIGMVSWSHDHNHFSGTDPLTNIWWNSTLNYELR